MGEVLKFAARAEDLTAESKRVGRKRLAIWLRSVDAKIEARELISFDARLARALTKFPSSTIEGHCWVGQTRLSRSLACCSRTVERSLARFKRSGLLFIRHRGAGRTARYIFCIDGKSLFPGLKQHITAVSPSDIATSGPSAQPQTLPQTAADAAVSGPAPTDLSRQAPTDLSRQGPTHVSGLIPSAPTKMSEKSTKELQADSFQTTTNLHQSSLQPKTAATSAVGERKLATDEDKPSIQVIQNAIVSKLGSGDVAQGWIAFGELPIPIRAELEARERRGQLTDAAIAEVLAGSPS